MNKPIKRHISLQPLSRDHHQGLLLCWKIRRGLKNGTPVHVIHEYSKWFYKEHLAPHFIAEEEIIFPVLGTENELTAKAVYEHKLIKECLFQEHITESGLSELADTIENHIRFEERILFNEIQNKVPDVKLKAINLSEGEQPFCDNSDFNFWN